MKEGNAIEVKNVTKAFKVYLDRSNNIKDFMIHGNRRRYEHRQVLKGISFEIKKGEAVGLIGHNGCGKSTTLKLLTKIMYPDSGTIEMKGRVSSLIELGAGFHPDMSGRENIYINASIFGLSKKEIEQRIDDIIKFSELEEYIDNPVRTYSSGMYMRLAFAVAINVNAEILLVDEILAVGDANFQSKCLNKMREIKAQGVTIVLVSHDSNMIETFCSKAIWIDAGGIAKQGNPADVVDAYMAHMGSKQMERMRKEEEAKNTDLDADSTMDTQGDVPQEYTMDPNHFGLGTIRVLSGKILDTNGQETKVLQHGEDYKIEIRYRISKPSDGYVFGIGFNDLEGNCLMGNNTQIDHIKLEDKDLKREGTVCCKVKNLPLLAGVYALNIGLVDESGTPLDFYRNYMEFTVESKDKSIGIFAVDREWEING